ncbi:hypothetical protein SERLADRAFT_401092, partial [Serpula lacrymans var. lacrymans S7.9]
MISDKRTDNINPRPHGKTRFIPLAPRCSRKYTTHAQRSFEFATLVVLKDIPQSCSCDNIGALQYIASSGIFATAVELVIMPSGKSED